MEAKNDKPFNFGSSDAKSDSSPSSNSFPFGGKKKEYLLSDKKTQTILYTSDSVFYVKRTVLSKSSPVFKSTFENKKDNELVEIPIKQYSSNAVYEAMKFIHVPTYIKYEIPTDFLLETLAFSFQYDIKSLYDIQSLAYENMYINLPPKTIISEYSNVQRYKVINCDKQLTTLLVNKIGRKKNDFTDVEYATVLSLNQSKKDELLLKALIKLYEMRQAIDNNNKIIANRHTNSIDYNAMIKRLESL
jgi:hypothetical protein